MTNTSHNSSPSASATTLPSTTTNFQKFLNASKKQLFPITPLKIHNIILALSIVVSGALLVAGLIGIVKFQDTASLDTWIEIHSQILNGVFTYLVILNDLTPRSKGVYWFVRHWHYRRTEKQMSKVVSVSTESKQSTGEFDFKISEVTKESYNLPGTKETVDVDPFLAKLSVLFPFARDGSKVHSQFKWYLLLGWMHILSQFGMAGLMWGMDWRVRPIGGVMGCLVGAWIFAGGSALQRFRIQKMTKAGRDDRGEGRSEDNSV
ncbi:hypothetical protein BKA69DRAFT_1044382 [Paraphysoderma sedebokerense]|nr:hypothetical protein BKA69DRAFT_1044382 [Paraphysoderma sedebokerense]